VRGQGGSLGPDLSEVGARRSPAYLREALTDPGASAPEGFLVISVTTRDGRRVRGTRINEDSFTIQLRDANNRFHSFRKRELAEVNKEFGASTMPSYQTTLTASEIDDLVAYLASLRGEK
jgi:putative heme-binding domain-containing protein